MVKNISIVIELLEQRELCNKDMEVGTAARGIKSVNVFASFDQYRECSSQALPIGASGPIFTASRNN